ncbi:hypothetical protein PRIPAC_85585 [Pristionchus pacificus]|uniref:Uncharacterized protein n=1 Tax=Pristionchus pacificus TaxID=54126 RepID=A0A2A6BT06_PRIPA|nr:hypothetical protein PRIPAC_85585 [Pristionchus pacificus]|eukprot:PDM69034.1 hypothetical protein PRIPAC_47336 [Pristionchus pacificus]
MQIGKKRADVSTLDVVAPFVEVIVFVCAVTIILIGLLCLLPLIICLIGCCVSMCAALRRE